MITRLRVEATGETDEDVKHQLSLFAHNAIANFGSPTDWDEEAEASQTTKTGFWGSLTLRRKRDAD